MACDKAPAIPSTSPDSDSSRLDCRQGLLEVNKVDALLDQPTWDALAESASISAGSVSFSPDLEEDPSSPPEPRMNIRGPYSRSAAFGKAHAGRYGQIQRQSDSMMENPIRRRLRRRK
jgi:hypothetical protein